MTFIILKGAIDLHSIGTLWLWMGFAALILLLLAMDFTLLERQKNQEVSIKQSLSWTLIWFFLAMIFNALLWIYVANTENQDIANQKALEFFTGYIIEESLSVDNMFSFLMIFNFFGIPPRYQRRTLSYGVIGAIIMRLIMILLGTWVISKLHWMLYIFGLFILITGIKLLLTKNDKKDLKDNMLLNWLRRHLNVTDGLRGDKFFIKQNLIWYATPLFLALIIIEFSDVIFALDSIPAIFAITNDPFIIFTSNIFAILGLRALYFLLANMAGRFYLLKYGVALILVFIGLKMIMEPWLKLSIPLSLGVVIATLATTIVLSVIKERNKKC